MDKKTAKNADNVEEKDIRSATDEETNEAQAEASQEDTNVKDVSQTRRIDVTAMEVSAKSSVSEDNKESEEKNKPDAQEHEYSAAEGTDASLLSEFAPKPMNIPNVNLEKEKKKQEKRKKNRGKEAKKVAARKNRGRKKQSTGQKVVAVIVGFLIFVVLTAALTAFISMLSVQITTSEYAFRVAVRSMDIAEIPIGTVRDSETLGMKQCSPKAALVDIIRDNSEVTVTYKEIISAIQGSGVDEFLAKKMKSASNHLLLGEEYLPVTGAEIASVIKDNATLVRNLTGRVLSDDDYTSIAAHFDEYGSMNEISAEALDATWLSQYTDYAKRLMSVKLLAALMVVCVLLIILLCVVLRGSAHTPLGWSFILSGIAVVLAAIFFRPSYGVSKQFLNTLLSNYFNFFTTAVVVIAGIFAVVGAFIFLVGNASADNEE